MPRLVPTAEITLGPFFPPSYVDAGANDLTTCEGKTARGEVIEIHGTVTQHDGTPLHNVVLEIWQADANGIFCDAHDPRSQEADPGFYGWGRAATDAAGRYWFRTIRPGRYAAANGTLRAPHVNLVVVFSGLMRQLSTVIFFDDGAGNGTDPVLTSVAPALCARMLACGEGGGRYRFDVVLRGARESVFFDD
ncbi:MAG TPA: protocatechuate 3,4-dioxygenase subunit alpha [Casimicrobiaceae bacterium]|nr:protocatechuate 3,4-dioxygenase subunit alpha [Casimicrobiaceae bacterium]